MTPPKRVILESFRIIQPCCNPHSAAVGAAATKGHFPEGFSMRAAAQTELLRRTAGKSAEQSPVLIAANGMCVLDLGPDLSVGVGNHSCVLP
jgi:hypothetical protein